MYSFRMSFWAVPRSASAGTPWLLGDEFVEEEQERCRRVDGHGRRDFAERDVREEELHVRDRVDGHSGPPHLPERMRIVRVVAELGREVESDREARLPPLEQVAEPLVRLLGGCEPCVLADRPRPAPVHVRVGPTRERELARRLEVEPRNVRGSVDRLDLDARVRFAPVLLDGHQLERLPPTPRVGCLRAGGRQAFRRPARAGRHGEQRVELAEGATAADVWASLPDGLGERPDGLVLAVNRRYAAEDTPLADGDEVALIPRSRVAHRSA